MTLQPVETLLAAVLVLLLGRTVNRLIPFLSRYNIPDPITGGLLVALGMLLLGSTANLSLEFDVALKPVLLLAFFAAVGLSANLSLLRQGGKRLLWFVLILAPFLLLQNLTGILIAWGLDLHPLMGLVGGSITLVGGHGTGAAYAERFAEVNNIQSIMELAMTGATLGLVLGGICGGPLAQWLIKRHQLAGADGHAGVALIAPGSDSSPISAGNLVPVLAAVLLAVLAGSWLADLVSAAPVTLPSFLWCLLLGVLIRNGGQLIGLRLNDAAIELISSLTLALFLAMTMMALNLASVASLAGPLLLILLGQLVVVVVYGGLLVYRAVGRDYESAVMSAAFCGFAMGATATAIANMQAIVQRYGPAPQAFLVVPLVGAFLIDLLNALVLTGFLALPGMGG
ncbi:sodium/glutamate symporter [Pseudomonas sp. L-22-4S-12]|uniref:sodium/glutamate symporter n=1 Tax=Pseudomonas sp. L-22-4S-12 TaxID=2610893 RepID=UPI00132A6C54|nr:sodium/glutamate symporter [Pseudomonas sp. L-22-4S-12]MWV15661.1 sodium/glutamate symporter [Pseudomonas sp. L-22-4S-12]